MKKTLFKLLALMTVMMMMLAACGGGGSSSCSSDETSAESNESENVLAGKTYEYVSMQVDGVDIELQHGIEGRKLTFNDDGTFILAGYRNDVDKFTVNDMTGTYKIDGNEVTMIIDWDPDVMVFDDESMNVSDEEAVETPEEDRTDHAVIDGDDLNFSMDLPKYDENGNETGETEHQTWVYSLVK